MEAIIMLRNKRGMDEITVDLEKAKRMFDDAVDDCAASYRDYEEDPCSYYLDRLRKRKKECSVAEAELNMLAEEAEEAWRWECGLDGWPQAV